MGRSSLLVEKAQGSKLLCPKLVIPPTPKVHLGHQMPLKKLAFLDKTYLVFPYMVSFFFEAKFDHCLPFQEIRAHNPSGAMPALAPGPFNSVTFISLRN